MQASSSSSERFFSLVGRSNENRAALQPDNLEREVVVAHYVRKHCVDVTSSKDTLKKLADRVVNFLKKDNESISDCSSSINTSDSSMSEE